MLIKKIHECIGNTPLVELEENIFAKAEGMNPLGSIKDRVALEMILAAERDATLKPGGTIIEPTSGNTGIALAAIGKERGYKVIICMPNNMSAERIKIMEAYGADVILTPKEFGMQGSIDMANDMKLEIANSVVLDQFNNKACVTAHFKGTGPEIYNDLKDVDVFVSAIGTGGTITGCAKYLKMKRDVYVVGVEPKASAFLTKGEKGVHKIQGIGAGFKPNILDTDYIDEIIAVGDDEAISCAKLIMRTYGISVGISSGAAYYAALEMKRKMPNKKIVVIFPDDSSKYMTTELFEV